MKKLTAVLVLILSISLCASAELRLKNPCSDNMVLQQNAEATVWGFAAPGSKITVSPSWGGSCSVRTGADGEWRAKVKTPAAGWRKYSIRISGDGSSITVRNVLVGEVWLASGQSNMEMPLKGWPFCPMDGSDEVIFAPSDEDGVRMFNVPKAESNDPVAEVEGQWLLSKPEQRPEMSATAYFFAKKLRETLNVPIGIIHSSYGGTMVECWASREVAASWGLPLDEESLMEMNEWSRQCATYNKMLHPLEGYTIKGVIWYQGCSNVGNYETYAQRFTDVMNEWRKNWNQGEFPVYIVEIAPYVYGSNAGQYLRDQQWKSAKMLPNCDIVPTNDLVHEYEQHNIHPGQKKPVGDRLAALALKNDYGYSSLRCNAMKVESVYCNGRNEICVKVSGASGGFRRTTGIVGLEVAGEDGDFYPVTAFNYDFRTSSICIRSEYVREPRRVRYCWGDWVIGNIISCDGYPLQTFNYSVGDFRTPYVKGEHDWAWSERYDYLRTEENMNPKAVFMGDSITELWYKLDPEFFNSNNYLGVGISGQTSSQMLCRFRGDVIEYKPQTVVILCGTNDVARNLGEYNPELTLRNIASMCDMARSNGIRVVLCSVPPCDYFFWNDSIRPQEQIADLNVRIKAYADREGIEYVDYYSAMAVDGGAMNSEYTDDHCHPVIAGYKVMENIVSSYLNK